MAAGNWTGPATVSTGPWQSCSASCGGGWQERATLCSSGPGGLLGEAWRCASSGLMSTPVSMPCK